MFNKPSKSIFKSKVFWGNVIAAAVTVGTAGLVPASIAVPIVTVGNILLRFMTDQPVHLVDR